MALCGAKARTGEPCRQRAMANGRCRYHGGLTPGGLASPNLITGRYSKYLPARLMERYQEALKDPALLELKEEIALLDGRLADLLVRVDTGESGIIWRRLQEARGQLLQAWKAKNTERAELAIHEIIDTIARGHGDWMAWQDIHATLEARRRLVESERKRLIDSEQMITAERAMLLFGAIGGIIKRHVSDPAILQSIAADLSEIIDPGAGQ